jgi:hypothetical protein
MVMCERAKPVVTKDLERESLDAEEKYPELPEPHYPLA